MNSKIKQVLLLAILLLPLTAMAHPGHDTLDGTSWAHYFASPLHFSIGLILFFLILSVAIYVRRNRIMR